MENSGGNVNNLRNKILAMKSQVDQGKVNNTSPDHEVASFQKNEPLIVPSRNNKKYLSLVKIDLEKIKPNPFQPRTIFEGIETLADSIREKGLLQPVTVIKLADDNYILIAGERRLRACKLIQENDPSFSQIDAIVHEDDISDKEKELLAALENLQRSDMTIIDTANMYSNISKYASYSEMSKALGDSKTAISRYIKISSLPNEIKIMLNKRDMRSSNKIELLALLNGNIEAQRELADDILNDDPIFRIESKIRKILKGEGILGKHDKTAEVILSIYEQIKPASKIITKSTYRKLDDENRNKVDEFLNTILEAQKQIEIIGKSINAN